MVLNFGKNSNDTGYSEVQIAILNFRINYLQKHFLKNKKDNHSRRGLLHMVSKRRKLLNFLKTKNSIRYNKLISKLNLRG
ncbi:30S ribosomal protein S15 [Sodalis-like secondary symbiont of Drepanosiphum platanoidis]|uniref:30S ribosomal protein S15 n=1 Tax=Sodalis-like secondary symbiont of Drepanosiphum platanoidis TaxID=2994493 RepID=UPI0034642D5A